MPAKGAIHSITAEATAAVRLAGVAKRFGRVEALAGVSLRAERHEVVAVVGPSGCGKSTLLELVCGLLAPDAGTVAADRAVLMPQRDLLLPWATALDNAALALRVTGVSRRQARERAARTATAMRTRQRGRGARRVGSHHRTHGGLAGPAG